MALSRLEQETTIRYNAEEDICEISTANPFDITYYDKLCIERPEWIKCVDRDKHYVTYNIPKKSARIRPPKQMSETAKQSLAEGLSRHRSQTLGNLGKSK